MLYGVIDIGAFRSSGNFKEYGVRLSAKIRERILPVVPGNFFGVSVKSKSVIAGNIFSALPSFGGKRLVNAVVDNYADFGVVGGIGGADKGYGDRFALIEVEINFFAAADRFIGQIYFKGALLRVGVERGKSVPSGFRSPEHEFKLLRFAEGEETAAVLFYFQ